MNDAADVDRGAAGGGGDEARRRDAADPLGRWREAFSIPTHANGASVIYLCGNSLGLQPKTARGAVEQELDDWARHGVEGHFRARTPWYPYHEVFRETGARLVGARPGEVVMMNSLTVNLHLMMVSFFRPSGRRRRVLMEWPAFPSDIYAIKTHLQTRGLDPDRDLLIARPRSGEQTLRREDLLALIDDHADELALVLVGGVNFFTGQVFDLAAITEAGHRAGAMVGFDLAHAAGNVELALHDWDVDFACWCSYKYLNAGPGAVAGCFVHQRHARDQTIPRFGGWWGNDPDTRFQMHLRPDFEPAPTADGWQLSNPPIMAMAPLRASLRLFDEVGMPALRAKSKELTGYLRRLIEVGNAESAAFEIITPADPQEQGAQLSILVHDRPVRRFQALTEAGVVCDFREPNV
ncbi:MAG: kynureninase, partial [Phycisphaerae bacterium]|nr:kynureninase [Phycisphaerae bacterium]